jgi:uncharacterized protein YfaS (alpha-2-macroglobulin family)
VRSFTQAAVMFSQPMAELGTFDDADQSLLTVEPPLPGKVVWINQFTLAFVPEKPLMGSLALTVRLSPEVRSLSGAALAPGDYVTSFRLPALATEWARSSSGSDPADALRPTVRAKFNQPVDPDLINGRSFFRWGGEGAPGRVPAGWDRISGWPLNSSSPLRAVAAGEVPKGTAWELVIERGAVIAEGMPPLGSDFLVGGGSTYGEFHVQFSGLETLEGQDAAGYLPSPERGRLTASFSNPVRLSEAAPFIEMEPPHPSFALQKEKWLRIAASKARAEAGASGGASGEPGVSGGAGDGAAARDGAAGSGGAGVPEEPVEDDSVQTWLQLSGTFIPRTGYRITFRKGMPDVYGQTLAEDFVVRFRTGSFAPSVFLLSQGGVMESAFPAALPVAARNVSSAAVFGKIMTHAETARLLNVWPYEMGNWPGWWVPEAMKDWMQAVKAGSSPGTAAREVKPPADSEKAQVNFPVSLSELFDGREREGVVFFGTDISLGNPANVVLDPSYSLFQVTDLAVTVKIGAVSSLAWVTRLSDGSGVGAADVAALDCEGVTIWSGTTGPGGLAGLPGAKEFLKLMAPGCASGDSDELRLHFSASSGSERVFWSLPWGEGFGALGNVVADTRDPLSGDWVSAFLLTSQPIYRPGETARLKIVARNFTADSLEAPAPGTVRVLITDPSGQALFDGPAEMGKFGTASVEWKIPEGAPYGNWKVTVDFDPGAERSPESIAYGYRERDYALAGSFRVSFYRAPAFDLRLDEMKDAYFGDSLDLGVTGSYHYGAPLDAGEADFELRYEAAWHFTPPGWDSGWSFTARAALQKDQEGGWASDPVPPGTAAEGTAEISPDGRASFRAVIPRDSRPVPRRYTLTVSAKDKDSRPVSRTGSFLAHPARLYAAVRAEGYVGEPSRPMKVKVAVTGPDGAAKPGETVKVSLYRRTWPYARRLSPDGTWSRVAELTDRLVSETEITSEADPVTVDLVPARAGTHFAVAELKDASGRPAMASCYFFVAGPGASWRIGDDEEPVELSADKSEYRPGETARILVQSPFESGTGLLTVERGGVRDARVFDLAGGAPLLEIPLGEDDAPSVYVSAVLVRGRVAPPPEGADAPDLGKPAFRKGYLTLSVLSDRDRLKVEVTPKEAEAVPGAEARIKVRVTDAAGRVFSDGEVALAAVDAGLIQIGGEEAFHPETLLWSALPLSVRSVGSLSAVLEVRDRSRKGGPAPGPAGGGGYEAAGNSEVRKDFRSVAHFEPGLKLDANGEAEAVFTLPDNLTTFRIFAVANGRGRAAGTGEGRLTVTRDLVLRASLPNHLTAGDEFEASAIVTSRAKTEGELSVTVRPRGGIELLEDPVKTVNVKPGESVEVSFSARATLALPSAGTGSADAAGGGGSAWTAGASTGSESTGAGPASGLGDAGAGSDSGPGDAGAGSDSGPEGDGSAAASGPGGGGSSGPKARDYSRDPSHAGTLAVGFDAALGAATDRALFTVPVGEAGKVTADATFTISGAGSSMADVRFPEGADPSRGGLELVFSPGVEGLLDAPLAVLASYPFNCLEQSTSRAAGALYDLRLSGGDGGKDPVRRDALRSQVAGQLDLIGSLSMGGGFAAWPGGRWSDRSPVLTAWVLDFLLEAREDGFGVSSELVDTVVSYLMEELSRSEPPSPPSWLSSSSSSSSSSSTTPSGGGSDSYCRLCGSDAARLYVMGAVIRGGSNLEGSIEPLYARRASLNLAERIFLLRAVYALPPSGVRTGQIMELVPMLSSEIELSGVTAQVKDPGGRENPQLWMAHQSDLSAQLLLALSEAAPRHEFLPALVLGSVSSGRGGDMGGTNRTVTILRGVWNFIEGQRAASGAGPPPPPPADPEAPAAGTSGVSGRAGAAASPGSGPEDGPAGAPPPGQPIDLAVKVLLGGTTVLDGKLNGPRDPSLRVELSPRDLLDGPPPSWQMEGTGKAWSFQRLSWAPRVPDLSARGTRGLVVTRSFQRVRPEPGPAGESSFRRGEVVKVTLTVMTTVPRYNLAVEDPVPAGLEPVDFSLRDQNPYLAELLASNPDAEDPWQAYWDWYSHEEIRPDSIRLFADFMGPGAYTYSYLARPVTPGTYLLPGPYAEEMYNPENYGRGAGLKLTVTR